MAELNPRLLPLFETLVAAGADWLVFELVDGIRAGVALEESADDLASARLLARQNREPRRTAERIAVSPQNRPLQGDEQISWAAHYVVDRLKNALDMIDASVDRMDRLVDDGRARDWLGARPGVALSLQDSDEAGLIKLRDRSVAQSAVQALLAALERWAGEVTDGREPL